MLIDGIFNIKGRGMCITGDVNINDVKLGDRILNKDGKIIGTVSGIEGSITNFGEYRANKGIIVRSRLDGPIPPKVGDEVTFDTVVE